MIILKGTKWEMKRSIFDWKFYGHSFAFHLDEEE
jgi:hypothetical protein